MRAYERLINYTKFESASDANSKSCPSTKSQLVFGEYLVNEMTQIGIKNAFMDKHGYVYGTIPANVQNVPTIGFIAHMDTVRDVPFENVKTAIIENYDGEIITLNEKLDITLCPKEFPELLKHKGKSILVTDGTTLLGADDKAGIAEILTMAQTLISDNSIKHGEIKIGFTPDEEIGRGADLFDVEGFGAQFAYTLDGSEFGTIEYENFNAAAAKIKINGVNIHPGTAKNKMKNALEIAMEFNSKLPVFERPQYTENYEGFYHLVHFSGIVEKAEMQYILRDHDENKLAKKKELLNLCAKMINKQYGENTIEIEIVDNYKNMRTQIEKNMNIITLATKAIEMAGGTAQSVPIRGGTDGARLSFMGLPCPNLGTGGHNYHGKKEYAVIEDMDSCVQVMINIATLFAQDNV